MGRAFERRKASKEKRWGKMSRVFPRLSKAITVAAKDGSDPDMNPRLRAAIQNAKSENMPKDNIDAAIKKATGKDQAELKELNYEGKGPHGTLIFVEAATDNNTRTVANIRNYFNKNGGQMLDNGSLEFMFSRKSTFVFVKTDDMDLEELELELIDAGLEEIEEDEGEITVSGDMNSFGSLSSALADMKIEVIKSELKRVATVEIELTEEQLEEVDKITDKIEEDDDVLAVYTNIG
jgi:YebC/PmpR family DNA-binding regulatory protein